MNFKIIILILYIVFTEQCFSLSTHSYMQYISSEKYDWFITCFRNNINTYEKLSKEIFLFSNEFPEFSVLLISERDKAGYIYHDLEYIYNNLKYIFSNNVAPPEIDRKLDAFTKKILSWLNDELVLSDLEFEAILKIIISMIENSFQHWNEIKGNIPRNAVIIFGEYPKGNFIFNVLTASEFLIPMKYAIMPIISKNSSERKIKQKKYRGTFSKKGIALSEVIPSCIIDISNQFFFPQPMYTKFKIQSYDESAYISNDSYGNYIFTATKNILPGTDMILEIKPTEDIISIVRDFTAQSA